MTDNDMQQFQFDKIGKKTPYNVPEGFFRDLESTLIRTIPEKAVETSQEVRTAPSRSLWLWAMKTTLSEAALVAIILSITALLPRVSEPEPLSLEQAFSNLSATDQEYIIDTFRNDMIIDY